MIKPIRFKKQSFVEGIMSNCCKKKRYALYMAVKGDGYPDQRMCSDCWMDWIATNKLKVIIDKK